MAISTDPTVPLVAIVGITGKQGGSVARALMESDKPYRIRGLTRDANKPAAKAFSGQGVEIQSVSLSIGNEAAVRAAFTGADIVFAVTNFIEHVDKEREIAEGKLMVDAAKSASVKLFIWSALESFNTLSAGRLSNVAFFDSKAEVTAYAKQLGIPLAVVQAGYYASNLFDGVAYALKVQPDGSYLFRLPMAGTTRVPLIDVETDYGLYVRAAIESPALGAGSEVLSGRLISLDEIIAQLAEFTGKKIVYSKIDRASFIATFPFPAMAPTLADLCEAYEEFGYYGPKQVTSEDILARKPRSYREFLEATPKEAFPAEIRPA
ncbi:NAD(P)-binding protein [Mycena galericulata]|nr:NAD(P)-binding protein [Mycena galericulata]